MQTITTAELRGSLTQLRTRCWTGETTVSGEEAHNITGRSDDWMKVTKKLIDQAGLEHIRSVQMKARRNIRRWSLPFPMDNVLFVPWDARDKVESLVTEAQQQVGDAVDLLLYGGEIVVGKKTKVIKGYGQAKDEARVRLGSAFREADYPSYDELRKKFSLELLPWFDLAPAKSSDGLDSVLSTFKEEATAVLRGELLGVIKRIASQTQDEWDEKTGKKKRKRLFDSMGDDVMHWVEWMGKLNIGNDAALKTMLHKVRGAIGDIGVSCKESNGGYFVNALRQSDYFRQQIHKEFSAMAAEFSELLEVNDASAGGKQVVVKDNTENDAPAPEETPVSKPAGGKVIVLKSHTK